MNAPRSAGLVLLAVALAGAEGRSQARAPAKPAPPAASRRPLTKVLEGVVRGPDGRAVEGARVTFRPADHSNDTPARTITTDAEGRFRADLRGASRLMVRVEAKGLAGRSLPNVVPGSPLSVVLDRGRALEGTVRDAAGQPVPGARVEARVPTALRPTWDAQAGVLSGVTDARGRYRLEGVEAALLTLTAVAPGLGVATRANVRVGGRTDLVLRPGTGLSGVVLDPEGQPVPGALIRAETVPFGGGETAAADVEGRFRLGTLSPGTYSFVVNLPPFAPALVPDVVLAADGERDEIISLEAGTEVTGRLVDADERPLQGSIVLRLWGDHQPPAALVELLRVDAGQDGRFRLPRLPAGGFVFDARSPGAGRRPVDVVLSGREEALDLGDVVIEPGLAVRGRVVTAGGMPVGDAVVTASRRQHFFSGFADEETRSLSDGSFLLGGLAAGAYDLRATSPGHTSGRVEATAGGEPVEVKLGAAGRITGLVVEDGDRPVEGFHAQAQPADRGEQRRWEAEISQTVSAPDGRFQLEDVAVGTYVVRVIVPDRAPATVSGVKVAEGHTTDVGVLRVPRGGIVRGLVTDATGGPIGGARVTANTGEMDVVTWWGLLSDQADAQGAFEIRGVPSGSVRVRATHPDYASGQATVEVDPARGPAEARILLRQGGRIEGRARRRDSQPLAGQTVMLGFTDGPGMETPFPTTGADGSFVVEHVPPGQVMLSLMASVGPGRFVNTVTRQVEVIDGQTVSVELVNQDVLVSGQVTRNRAPAGGVELAFRSQTGFAMALGGPFGGSAPPSDGPRRNAATTREDGGFELIVSEPGRYHVSAHSISPRISLPARTVEIPDAETFGLDLEFTGVPVSGLLVAKDTQEPVAEGSVSASPREPRDGEGQVGARTRPDGRFDLLAAPGDYTLTAMAEGYARASQPLALGESGVGDLKVELERGLEIRGRVVNASGQAVAGVQVMALGPGKWPDRSFAYTQSRGDGSFALGSLRDAAHNLAAGSALLGYALRPGVKAGARDLTLTLQPGGRLRLRVLDREGAPVKDVFPQVQRVNRAEFNVPVFGGRPTDAAGITEIDVPAGALEVRVLDRERSGRTPVDVGAGQTAEAEIRLTDPPERD